MNHSRVLAGGADTLDRFCILRFTSGDYFDLAVGSTLNPALSLSFALAGHQGAALAELAHILPGQFLGHLVAVRAARAASADVFVSDLNLFSPPSPTRSGGLTFARAAAIEAALTFTLALAALGLGRVIRGPIARSVITTALVLALIAAGTPFTGALLNPAMALALAVHERGVSAALADRDLYVYVAGPCAGAAAAAAVFRHFVPDRRKHWIEQLMREREAQQQVVTSARRRQDVGGVYGKITARRTETSLRRRLREGAESAK